MIISDFFIVDIGKRSDQIALNFVEEVFSVDHGIDCEDYGFSKGAAILDGDVHESLDHVGHVVVEVSYFVDQDVDILLGRLVKGLKGR